jgi:hypothetical protein
MYLTLHDESIATGLYVFALTPHKGLDIHRYQVSKVLHYWNPVVLGIDSKMVQEKCTSISGKPSIFYFSSLIICLLSINCPSTITASIFLVLLISSNGLSDRIIISACFPDSMVPTSLSIPRA